MMYRIELEDTCGVEEKLFIDHWCAEEIGDVNFEWRSVAVGMFSCVYLFEYEEDAVMFKMRWA